MAVILRKKPLKSGKESLYLEINRNGKREYEFIKLYLSGKKRATSADKETMALAEMIRTQREHELVVQEQGLPAIKSRNADFFAYFEVWAKGRKRILRILKHLRDFSKPNVVLPFRGVTKKFILDFQGYLMEGRGNNTVREYLGYLRMALDEATREGFLHRNPFAEIAKSEMVKRTEPDTTFLTLEQVQLLAKTEVKGMPEDFRDGFLLECFCGVRFGDLHRLTVEHIHFMEVEGEERMFLNFRQGKTQQAEFLPLSATAETILRRRLMRLEEKAESRWVSGGIKEERLFPRIHAKSGKAQSALVKMLYWLDRWGKAAELPFKLTTHIGRHTFATLALNNGTQLKTVSKLLGHQRIATTERYAKVMDRSKIEAVDRLPGIENNVPILLHSRNWHSPPPFSQRLFIEFSCTTQKIGHNRR